MESGPRLDAWERLELERENTLLRVWLSRPERRNALDTETLDELAKLFSGLRSDFQTRVVILGGRGPSFCAGADRGDPPGSARMRSSSGASERIHVCRLRSGRSRMSST